MGPHLTTLCRWDSLSQGGNDSARGEQGRTDRATRRPGQVSSVQSEAILGLLGGI